MSPRRVTFCCCRRRTKTPSLDCLTCPTGMTRILTRAGTVKERTSRPMVALERRSRARRCLPCWMQMRSAAIYLGIHGRWSYDCLILSMERSRFRSERFLLALFCGSVPCISPTPKISLAECRRKELHNDAPILLVRRVQHQKQKHKAALLLRHPLLLIFSILST